MMVKFPLMPVVETTLHILTNTTQAITNQITDVLTTLTGLAADTYTFVALDAQGCASLPVDIEITEPLELLIDELNVVHPAVIHYVMLL